MMHLDNTITVGNLLTILCIVGTLIGIWLRSEKLIAILSIRVDHVETRLNGHDDQFRDDAAWRLNHVSHTNKSAYPPRSN